VSTLGVGASPQEGSPATVLSPEKAIAPSLAFFPEGTADVIPPATYGVTSGPLSVPIVQQKAIAPSLVTSPLDQVETSFNLFIDLR